MNLQYYTYFNPKENIFENALYKKHTPKAACRSIFRRILREANNREKVDVKLIIKNIDTGKLYYYKCMAVYDPVQKRINDKFIITIKYDINIIKLNKDVF